MAKTSADDVAGSCDAPVQSVASEREATDLAFALRYQAADAMPRIVARGAGKLAQKIVALAEEHSVPVHKDGAMVELLRALDSEQVVPAEARAIVSEVLCFLYHLDTMRGAPAAQRPKLPSTTEG